MGHVPQTEIEIYANDDEGKAPIHLNRGTRPIATLSIDLNRIDKSVKHAAEKRRMGVHQYYCLSGVIEASYGSAEITYAVKLGGMSPITLISALLLLTNV